MEDNGVKVLPTTEIVGAMMVGGLDSSQLDSMRSDPKDFIYTHANVEIVDDFSVSVVDNSSGSVNLVLPYYTTIDEHATQRLGDGEMDGVSGGEIIISILVGVGLGAFIGTVTTIGGTTGAVVGLGVGIGVGVTVATTVATGVATGVSSNQHPK